MSDIYQPPPRTWRKKFADALQGVGQGAWGQSSFAVHCAAATVVVLFASALQLNHYDWGLLLLCIAMVMSAELFNSAVELLAREVDRRHNPTVGKALDIASGAVLVAALGAACVGSLVLLPPLYRWIGAFAP
ncbi:diacylglycerol kinase [Lignipirellula cremea]|uniref:Undecaprenol kinase n=1 Tax=Lignipirellula cremea TaxID=2528010 RepID=A0A518DZU9_9BACT|nr:diacylglycerol kinase [Lignipirellula cremea]QDU97364.1 Undecaprenol kinase [Lignipirellula cremea]